MKSSAIEQPKYLLSVKTHGYQLTDPYPFALPHNTASPTLLSSIINSLLSITPDITPFIHTSPKIATILNDKILILAHSTKVVIIAYGINNDQLTAQSKGCFLMNAVIKNIACSYYLSSSDKSQSHDYFALEYVDSNLISLFRVDQHNNVTAQHSIKQKDKILAMRFINHDQIMLLLRNKQVRHYVIRDNHLKSSGCQFKITLDQDHQLKSAEICTAIIEDQVHVCLFYTVNSRKYDKSYMHLIQFLKDDGTRVLEHGTFFDLFGNDLPQEMLQNLSIYSYRDSFLIHNGLAIFLVQKKFGKYVKTDVVSQLGRARKIRIIDKKQHLFICSVGISEIQLWEFQLKEKEIGCTCRLLDVIEADGQAISGKIIKVWIFVTAQKPQFALLLDGGSRKVQFYLTKKEDKLAKLVKRVKKQEQQCGHSKPQKLEFMAKLRQIQQLGQKLGFNKKQFYLKLWHQSQKNSPHIFQYLLPCMDFKIIFSQLTLYLRVKTLTVNQLIRVLKKIQTSLLEQLQKKLDLQMIRQFLKTNFQRRKLKLISGQIALDFHKYQNYYESSLLGLIQRSIDLLLFPQKFKHDIVWKQQVQQKPIHIPYILRQFRLIILQNYPQFLMQLLQPYKYHLKRVLQNFPYLMPQYPLKISMVREQLVMLSNIYPNQKLDEQQQYTWLNYIRQNQWERQNSSVDFLMHHLFAHHPTSLINDRLKQFAQGKWCIKHKWSKHILLQLSKTQFQAQLPAISDATSLLFLCEMSNRISLEQNRQCQSQQILQIMFKFNSLPEYQFNQYRLYCKLHHLLVRQKLIESSMTILQLKALPEYKIVTYFFLSDHERIDLLFVEIAQFYPNSLQFNRIIQSFIGSEDCSKIQLQMLVNYIRTLGEQYQKNNQELLQIIVIGFLKRIEVRQINKSNDFMRLFKKLAISEQLLIQLSIFQSIRDKQKCYLILNQFDMGHFTFDTVMNNPQQIIQTIVDYYFTHYCQLNSSTLHKSIYIQGRQINLSYPKNIFVIILYIKDKIYSYRKELDLYLCFCEAVIGWNQFQLIVECFSQEIIIDGNYVSSQEFYTVLINYMFGKYYEDQELMYTQETKEHIVKLLGLIRKNAELTVVETAKIQFVQIFEAMDLNISLQYMQIIKHQWSMPQERAALFHELIDNFMEKLTFQTVKIKLGESVVIVKTQQFISYALYFCRQLVIRKSFTQICEIIYFLNHNQNQYKARYSIMTQCFLQVLSTRLHPQLKIRQSNLNSDKIQDLIPYKQKIDEYIINYTNIQRINDLFMDKFALGGMNFDQNDECFYVDIAVNLQDGILSFSRSYIWNKVVQVFSDNVVKQNQMALQKLKHSNSSKSILANGSKSMQANSSKSILAKYAKNNVLNIKDVLYCYYFIQRILIDHSYLEQLEEISYSHHNNILILEEIYKDQKYRKSINFRVLYQIYMKGLFKYYFTNVYNTRNQESSEIQLKIREIKEMEESKLFLLITDLPLDNQFLGVIKCMKKIMGIIINVTAFELQEDKEQKDNSKNKQKQKSKDQGKPRSKSPKYMFQSFSQKDHSQSAFLQISRKGNNFKDLKQSITQVIISDSSQKTYRFDKFHQIKKNYASKTNLTSQKMLITKVLDELEQQEHSSNQSIQINTPLLVNNLDLGTRNRSSDHHNNLQRANSVQKNELNMQKQTSLIKINSMDRQSLQDTRDRCAIVQQLSQIGSYECQHHILDDIKSLLILKDYKTVREQYEVKQILKVINNQYYGCVSMSQSTALPRITPKKKINRSNTINQHILEAKMLVLFQALDGLKLYNFTNKLHILRNCLIIISSEELKQIQNHLLKIFKVNVLLDPIKDITAIFNTILTNVKEMDSISLQKFEVVAGLIALFLQKNKEEYIKHRDLVPTDKNKAEEEEYLPKLYLQYLRKLILSGRGSEQQQKELTSLIRLIRRDKLYLIHHELLTLLEPTQLYEPYIIGVHQLFMPSYQ